MNKIIKVFDSTLRDGEQVPGAKLEKDKKLVIAEQLAILGVDIIEAGFPASSPGDLEAVKIIAQNIKNTTITALARATKSDIDAVWDGIKYADNPRIHIVLGSSDIHINKKFSSTREDILERGVAAVRYAKKLTNNVQYSAEDASRSDFDYLCQVINSVSKAGATVVNIPDTIGYAIPEEFGSLCRKIRQKIPRTDNIELSVHCHNDLGLATINTLAAVKNSIDQVEVTMNGIGERAGNAALEEVIMALKMRPDYYQAETNIRSQYIMQTSQMVSELMNISIQPNKAITGANAFAHSSGIHQDGLLKDKSNYQFIDPEIVGARSHKFVLTARSGKHALKHCLQKLGYEVTDKQLPVLHKQFLIMADQKKQVNDADLKNLIAK